MTKTVEIFYSFQCPYSYLAFDRLYQIGKKFDVKVLWQPFSAKASGKNFQGTTIAQEKATYMVEDSTRIAKEMGLPIVFREGWPETEFDPERSIRGAVVAGDLELELEYNVKLFDRWWGQGLDPNEQAFLIELADDLDIDVNEFAGRMSTTDTRERVRGIYKRGKKLQVFETPTIVIGEERFVGIDRIEAAEKRLKELGW